MALELYRGGASHEFQHSLATIYNFKYYNSTESALENAIRRLSVFAVSGHVEDAYSLFHIPLQSDTVIGGQNDSGGLVTTATDLLKSVRTTRETTLVASIAQLGQFWTLCYQRPCQNRVTISGYRKSTHSCTAQIVSDNKPRISHLAMSVRVLRPRLLLLLPIMRSLHRAPIEIVHPWFSVLSSPVTWLGAYSRLTHSTVVIIIHRSAPHTPE